MIRVTEDELVAALDSTKEFAPVLTKLGILVLAQLTGFNLALGPDALIEHAARWAGVDVKGLREAAAAERHKGHGAGTADDGPDEPDCPCRDGQLQAECAGHGCGFCLAAQSQPKESDGNGIGPGPAAGAGGDQPSAQLAPDEQRA
jgi:hypothetical protein